jgi:hypothetical protein
MKYLKQIYRSFYYKFHKEHFSPIQKYQINYKYYNNMNKIF